MSKNLNIVSFDVPYPPNYGGVIDVFYKIKSLKKLGVKIFLHTFEYGKDEQLELDKYCEKVHYYKRNISSKHILSRLPFIIKTRANQCLIKRLENNNYPILFEGLHTTFPLLKNDFKDRILIVRTHNIEHNYYEGLSKSESNMFKKMFFRYEALKLKKYQSVLNKVNYILTISLADQEYFSSNFLAKSIYTPVFHQNNKITSVQGKGKFALYHGDLRVSDNIRSCKYLIKIFSEIDYPLIISGSHKNFNLLEKIKPYPNISFKNCSIPTELDSLFKNAQINVLPTFQNTGIKLKLINALFSSRFCLVNNKMVENTGLEDLCSIANSKKEFIEKIQLLSQQEFTEQHISKRGKKLHSFDTINSAKKIVDLLN